MESILLSSTLLRMRYITSVSLLLFFTVFSTIAREQKAAITTDKDDCLPDEWVIEPGFAPGITASDDAVAYFMYALITNVSINATLFCGGQPVIVSYTTYDSGEKFGKENIFTAQLSDASGSFSSPVIIGTLKSKLSGVINAIIPSGTANGSHYRIRVVSSYPIVTSNPNETDLTISVLPTAPASVNATPTAICAGASSYLSATSTGNSIRWYTTSAGGSLLGASASGANFSVTPVTTTTYYAESLNAAGCASSERTAVMVTVNSIPTITSTSPGSVCGNGTVTLTAASSAGVINWYSDASGGVILGTGISFTTPVINLNTTYYVDATSNGCVTATRTPVYATVYPAPTAPLTGTITQPTCMVSTGSVILNGLPATGTWTLTRTPGGIIISGTGTVTTITGLTAGTYTFTVTNASGCISPASGNVVINTTPGSPSAPVAGGITQPTCSVSTGSVILNGLPATGTWTLTRTPGGVTTSGTGTVTTITGLTAGTYTFTVTNASGCISPPSGNVVINGQPAVPTADAGTGGDECDKDFILNAVQGALPGTWTKIGGPGNAVFSPDANQANARVTVYQFGAYDFAWTVANTLCVSSDSVRVTFHDLPSINAGADTAVCTGGSILLNAFGSGSFQWSPADLVDNQAISGPVATPVSTTVFTVTLTDKWGCINSDQVNVEVREQSVAYAGPDQVLEYIFETALNAAPLGKGQTGEWTIISGTGEFADKNDNATHVSKLSTDNNIFKWTLSDAFCPSSVDHVNIMVHDMTIPTLITPNNDGKNDYLIINGIETLGKTELVVFNRWGARVYVSDNYDNEWNGVNDNLDPLPDDTYFFILSPVQRKPVIGYIVIKR